MVEQEPPVVWDLSDLYAGLDDPALQTEYDTLRERARAFEERYRGRIADADCAAETLLAALTEYEAILSAKTPPLSFASLMFSADTSDPARGALYQKLQVDNTAISTHLIFFDLEVGQMPPETFQRLVGEPTLARYRHYLEYERTAARHNLTEAEEKIVAELGNTGHRAFLRLYSEITSRIEFRVELNGEVQVLNQSQTLALLEDGDRSVRAAASAAVTAAMKEHSHVLTFIFNNLLQERATVNRLRSYDYPEQVRHESNELSPEVVQSMVDVCTDSYDVVADYYRLKRGLLGLDELTHWDRYAPIGDRTGQIPFAEAQATVLEAFADFTPRMREMAEPFFTRNWIDAEARQGKRGGAFCSYIVPEVHPYVFMNYTSRARDVMTLAHELGHALHGVLASENSYLNYYPSLPLGETASVFAEMLVFEKLQARMDDPREKLSLLAGKIESSIATVFRQSAIYRFEQAAHRKRREEGEQTTEGYNELWQQTMQAMFGDALTLGEEHAWWWLYIPHIYHTPFYVYSYSFGELLVLALYARYKQEGEPFVQRYLDLLAKGGSQKPEEVLAQVGIDIREREFWQGGVDLLRDMVERAKALAAEIA